MEISFSDAVYFIFQKIIQNEYEISNNSEIPILKLVCKLGMDGRQIIRSINFNAENPKIDDS